MASDEINNNSFIKGFENDNIIQQELQSKSKKKLEAC